MSYNIYDLESALKKVLYELKLSNKLKISKSGIKLTISCNGTTLYSIIGHNVNNCFTHEQFTSTSISNICYRIKNNLVDTLNKFSVIQNSFNLNSDLVENKLRSVLGSSFDFNVTGNHFYIETIYNEFNIYYIGNGKYKVEPEQKIGCNEHDIEIITKATEALDGLIL